MKTKINVTLRDIRAAKRALKRAIPRSRCCPISQAARREFGVKLVTTGTEHFRVWKGEQETVFALTVCAKKFVALFDSGEPVKPFSFYVRY